MHLHGVSSVENHHGPANGAAGSSSRSMDRVLDEAQFTGELVMSGRLMNKFPVSKHNLIDTSKADLSRNRFVEIPREIWQLVFLEYLNFRENLLRAIPNEVCRLTCLIELDLSRNNISTLPASLCKLPLQILLVGHNRLTSLPVEIGQMKCLKELDVSCNDIDYLPHSIGGVSTLRRLDLRKNKLTQLPTDIKKLSLVYLDISQNLIAFLPSSLLDMASSLQTLIVHDNPLQAPTALVCYRGKVHIFKSLERAMIQRSQMPREPRDISLSRRPDGPIQPPVRLTPEKPAMPPLTLNTSVTGTVLGIVKLVVPSQPAAASSVIEKPSYAIPPKMPVSTSCPVIAKTPLQISPTTFGELSNTSSPSSSGVASGTDGASDEGVESMTGNCDSDGPAAVVVNGGDKAVPTRKMSNTPTEVPKKILSSQTGSNGHRVNGSLVPPSSQTKGIAKPPLTVHRRLSNSSATTPRDSPQSISSHPSTTTMSTTVDSNSQNSARSTVTPRSMLPKPSSATKREVPSGSIAKPRVSPGRNGASRTALNTDRPDSAHKDVNPNFTIRRQQEQIREEAEKLDMLKKYIEARLKLTLPEDVMESLQDGVVLCHLVNNIRPRSVISIHVPSNTQTGPVKLTPAKSRRNVENFLDACRRLGVPDALLCTSGDILEAKSPSKVFGCVNCLLQLDGHMPKRGVPLATASHVPAAAQHRIGSARTQPTRDFSAV